MPISASTARATMLLSVVVVVVALCFFQLTSANPQQQQQQQFESQDVNDVEPQYDSGREGDQWWRNYEVVEDRVDDRTGDDHLEMLYMYSVNPEQFASSAFSTRPPLPPSRTSAGLPKPLPASSSFTNQPFAVSRTSNTIAPTTTTTTTPQWSHQSAPSTFASSQQPNLIPRKKLVTAAGAAALERITSSPSKDFVIKSKPFLEVTKKPVAPFQKPVATDATSYDPRPAESTFSIVSRTTPASQNYDFASSSSRIEVGPTAPTPTFTAAAQSTLTSAAHPFIVVANDHDRPRYAKLLNRYSLLDPVVDTKDLKLASSERRDEITSENPPTEKLSLRHVRNDVQPQPPSARSFQAAAAAAAETESAYTTTMQETVPTTTITTSKRSRRRRPKTTTELSASSDVDTEKPITRRVSFSPRPLTEPLQPTTTTPFSLPPSTTPTEELHLPSGRPSIGGHRRPSSITPSTSSPATIDGTRTTVILQQPEVPSSLSPFSPTTQEPQTSIPSLTTRHGRTRAHFTLSTAFIPTSTDQTHRRPKSDAGHEHVTDSSRFRASSPRVIGGDAVTRDDHQNDEDNGSDVIGAPPTSTTVRNTHKPRNFRPRASSTSTGAPTQANLTDANHVTGEQHVSLQQVQAILRTRANAKARATTRGLSPAVTPSTREFSANPFTRGSFSVSPPPREISPISSTRGFPTSPSGSTRGLPASPSGSTRGLPASASGSTRAFPPTSASSTPGPSGRRTTTATGESLAQKMNTTVTPASTHRPPLGVSRGKFRSLSRSSTATTTTEIPLVNSTALKSPIGKKSKQRPPPPSIDLTRPQKSKKPYFGSSTTTTVASYKPENTSVDEPIATTKIPFTKKFSPRGTRFRSSPSVDVTVPITDQEATTTTLTSRSGITRPVATTTLASTRTSPEPHHESPPSNNGTHEEPPSPVLEFSKLKRRRRPTKFKKSVPTSDGATTSPSEATATPTVPARNEVIEERYRTTPTATLTLSSRNDVPQERLQATTGVPATATVNDVVTLQATNAPPLKRRKLRIRKLAQRSTLSGSEEHKVTNATTTVAESSPLPVTSATPTTAAITTVSTTLTSTTQTAITTNTPTAATQTQGTTPISSTQTQGTTPISSTQTQGTTPISSTQTAISTQTTRSAQTERSPPTERSTQRSIQTPRSTPIVTEVTKTTERTKKPSSESKAKNDTKEVKVRLTPRTESVTLQAEESGDSAWFAGSGRRQGDVMLAVNGGEAASGGSPSAERRTVPIFGDEEAASWFSPPDEANQKGAESSQQDVKVASSGIDTRPLLISRISEDHEDVDGDADVVVDESATSELPPTDQQDPEEEDTAAAKPKPIQKSRTATFSVSSSVSTSEESSEPNSRRQKTSVQVSNGDGENSQFIVIDKKELRGSGDDDDANSRRSGDDEGGGTRSRTTTKSSADDATTTETRKTTTESTMSQSSESGDVTRKSGERKSSSRNGGGGGDERKSTSSTPASSRSTTSKSDDSTTKKSDDATTASSTTTMTSEDVKAPPSSDTAVSYFGEDEESHVAEAIDAGAEEGVGAAESSYDPDSAAEIQESADEVIEHSDPNEDSAHLKVPAAIEERSSADDGMWGSSSDMMAEEPIRSSSSINVEVLSRAPRLMQFVSRRDSSSESADTSPRLLRKILKATGSDEETYPADFDSVTTKRDVSAAAATSFAYPVPPPIKTVEDIVQLFDAAVMNTSPSKDVQGPFKPPSKAVILKISSDGTAKAPATSSQTGGETRRPMIDTPKAPSRPTNCSKMERNMCPKSEGYPRELVNSVLREHADKLDRLWSEIQAARTNTGTFPEEQERKTEELSVCDSSIEALQPGWARDSISGKWMVVINTAQYPQVIRIESCLRPKRECLFISPYYKSTCVEHYSVHRLVAISPDSPDDGPTVGIFKFPCGCSCKVEMFLGQSHDNK